MVGVRRRRREPLVVVVEERGVRENTVCYDDEGGGEEDTEAFSMLAFSMLALRPLGRRGQSQQNQSRRVAPPHGHAPLQQLMERRLQQADLDSAAPPYDSLQTYALEGSASSAASVSSLTSLHSSTSHDSQQSYHFLKDWGPPFQKLAHLYGNQEGGGALQEDDQPEPVDLALTLQDGHMLV